MIERFFLIDTTIDTSNNHFFLYFTRKNREKTRKCNMVLNEFNEFIYLLFFVWKRFFTLFLLRHNYLFVFWKEEATLNPKTRGNPQRIVLCMYFVLCFFVFFWTSIYSSKWEEMPKSPL